jgi:hypothetical protein
MSLEDQRNRQQTLDIRERIQMSPDSPFVYQPRFVNPEKTRLRAIVRMPNGSLTEMEVDVNDVKSPVNRDIFAQYTQAELELFTERHTRMTAAKREMDQRIAEDKQLNEVRDAAYKAKAEAFQIPEIANMENQDLQRKIRMAKTATEVLAWTAVALSQIRAELANLNSD